MNAEQLNKDLCTLIDKRNALAAMDYNDEAYDDAEEALHDFEDSFIEEYGAYLEKAFQSVHDEHCPDNDVLLPIAYIAKKYIVKKDKEGNTVYGVGPNQGVLVDHDDYPGHDVRLMLVPSPTRIVMTIDNAHPKVVWQAE